MNKNPAFFCLELVVALDSSDDFLKERIMNLPETEVEGTHNSEAGEGSEIGRATWDFFISFFLRVSSSIVALSRFEYGRQYGVELL